MEPREQREDEQGQEEPDDQEVQAEAGEVQEEAQQVHLEEPEEGALQGNGNKTVTCMELLSSFQCQISLTDQKLLSVTNMSLFVLLHRGRWRSSTCSSHS